MTYPSNPLTFYRKTILASDPYFDEENCMQFRLTYEGKLFATQDNDARSRHKHDIRKKLHPQLKRLWEQTTFLSTRTYAGHLLGMGTETGEVPTVREEGLYLDHLASQFSMFGYNFVPLVTPELFLLCKINILFLRPETPGLLVQSGDIDNRLKTIFDALRMPARQSEVGGYDVPEDNEKPFYCLLQDDKLITGLSVETDLLLEPIETNFDIHDARLVITVELNPYRKNFSNLEF